MIYTIINKHISEIYGYKLSKIYEQRKLVTSPIETLRLFIDMRVIVKQYFLNKQRFLSDTLDCVNIQGTGNKIVSGPRTRYSIRKSCRGDRYPTFENSDAETF